MKKTNFLYLKKHSITEEIYRNKIYDQNNAVEKLLLRPNSG